MITATCNNNDCQHNGIGYNFFGEPPRVECGACHADCDLTGPTADFPDPPT